MTKVIDSSWTPSDVTILAGPNRMDGSLNLLLDKLPDWSNIVYLRREDCLMAMVENFMRIYVHRPGTFHGFGGSEIVLSIQGEGEVHFNGSLWDPTSMRDIPDSVPEFVFVSITDDPIVFQKGYTYRSAYILRSWYDELMAKINKQKESP